jgi:acyl carrier protein
MHDKKLSNVGRANAMIASYFDADPRDVLPETKLVDLGADVLDVAELVLQLEDELDVDLFGVEDGAVTVGDVLDAVEQAVGRPAF